MTGWSRSVSFCATFRSQSISPPGPYLCFNHSFVFLKCPQSNYVYTHISPPAFKTKKPQRKFRRRKNTHKALMRTQRTRMHTIQNTVSLLINPLHPPQRRSPPSQEHNPSCTLLIHHINHLLRKLLPPLFWMTVGQMRSHRQTGIEQEYAAVCPWG